MLTHHDKYIFLDLETTGPRPASDLITEIGIVEVTDHGVTRWSTLVNPQVPIPPFIQELTGITDAMVENAPTFAALSEQVRQRLQRGLVIAHNARFDYGFLRHAYQRLNQPFQCEVLCSIKLSRKLFPEEVKHGLDALMARHGLVAPTRHRALADADLLWQFWRMLETTIPADTLARTMESLLERPHIPRHLQPELLDDIPDGPGVYLFRGEGDEPLYLGKALQLRPRVLSHVVTDRLSEKERRLAQQIRRIEWHETAGEMGAALLEAKLAKQLHPAHSRTTLAPPEVWSWQLQDSGTGRMQPVLACANGLDFGRTDHLYGLFNSREKAEMALRALASSHGLTLAAAEDGKVLDDAWAGYKLHLTSNAGTDEERTQQFRERLAAALAPLRLQTWPFPGTAATIVENGANGAPDIHLIHNWCYLGTARSDDDLCDLLEQAPANPSFDVDTYKIVTRALKLDQAQLHPLAPSEPAASRQFRHP